MYAKSLQSCPTRCDPIDCSPPGSSVHGILQARILEWVAVPSPRGSPDPGIEPESLVSPASAGVFTTSTTLYDGLNGYTSQNSTSFSSLCASHHPLLSETSHQDSKTCCYLMCTYERKKILPIKLYHTIIRCIPIPDMWKCGGGSMSYSWWNTMSAAVNSDIIEDSGFDPREVLYCFLLFLIGFTVFCPFKRWDCFNLS